MNVNFTADIYLRAIITQKRLVREWYQSPLTINHVLYASLKISNADAQRLTRGS